MGWLVAAGPPTRARRVWRHDTVEAADRWATSLRRTSSDPGDIVVLPATEPVVVRADDEQRCGARWWHRGKTAAWCFFQEGHAGRHHNGTRWWRPYDNRNPPERLRRDSAELR